MTAIEVKEVLANNRQLVISYFNENVKQDSFYNLGWFMTRILQESEIVWRRRKNVSEKEIMSVIAKIMKQYPQIAKDYISNFEKAVNYFGEDKAKQMMNIK
jgi:hypothetical protein